MKRFLIFLTFTLLLISVFTLLPAAESPDEGTVNSAALNYFTGIVNKLPANSDYVIFRTGDYTSDLVYGYGLVYDGTTISSDDDIVRITYNTRGSGSSGNYTPTLSEEVYNSFSLATSDTSILYSSLGSWATVGDTSKDNVTYILWSIVFLILIYIVYRHVRNRRYYINL